MGSVKFVVNKLHFFKALFGNRIFFITGKDKLLNKPELEVDDSSCETRETIAEVVANDRDDDLTPPSNIRRRTHRKMAWDKIVVVEKCNLKYLNDKAGIYFHKANNRYDCPSGTWPTCTCCSHFKKCLPRINAVVKTNLDYFICRVCVADAYGYSMYILILNLR